MDNEKLFRVRIELDVTAKDETEAVELAVGDIFEMQAAGDLDADVVDLGEELKTRNFATQGRMLQIANNALDYIGEMLRGEDLYNALSGSLGMTDEEILAAGFTTLKEYFGGEDDA